MDKSGFLLENSSNVINPGGLPMLAALSFRAGLNAYFSSGCHGDHSGRKGNPPLEFDLGYLTSYSETVLHFHHCAELVIKELLREVEDENNLKSMEFFKALDAIIKHINQKPPPANYQKLSFISDQQKFLNINNNDENNLSLNRLRNRLIHRGLFVLYCPVFDLQVCQNWLPFFDELLNLPRFVDAPISFRTPQSIWKYKSLHCGIDPLTELIKLGGGDSKISRKKRAFLKELGRAAYRNPLGDPREPIQSNISSDTADRSRAIHLAKTAIDNNSQHEYKIANTILKCPVCGLNSLVRYHHDLDEEYGLEVRCMCCTFGVDRSLGNGSQYGWTMDEFWIDNQH